MLDSFLHNLTPPLHTLQQISLQNTRTHTYTYTTLLKKTLDHFTYLFVCLFACLIWFSLVWFVSPLALFCLVLFGLICLCVCLFVCLFLFVLFFFDHYSTKYCIVIHEWILQQNNAPCHTADTVLQRSTDHHVKV